MTAVQPTSSSKKKTGGEKKPFPPKDPNSFTSGLALKSLNTEEENGDIYSYIKSIKKELTKKLKDGREGVVSNFHKNLLEDMQISLKPLKTEIRNSFLDNPILNKSKPKRVEKPKLEEKTDRDIEKSEDIIERRNTRQSNKSLEDMEKKMTKQSIFTQNNSMKLLNVDNKDSIVKMMNKSVTKGQLKNESYYEFEKERKIKKELILENLRNKKRDEYNKHCKEKPTLTQISKQIIKKKFNGEKPLYLRTNEIIERKIQTIKTMQRFLLDKESQEITKNSMMTKNNRILNTKNTNQLNNTTQPFQYNNISSISESVYDHKKFEEWRHFAMDWQKRKNEKHQKMKEDKSNEIYIDEISKPYKPLINYNSEYLATVINNDVPIFQRLYNRQLNDKKKKTLNKIYRDTTPNFRPNIMKNVPSYLKNVESRLMTVSSAPDLSLKIERKHNKDREKAIHKSKTMNHSLHSSQSSISAKKSLFKNNSVAGLKKKKITKDKSWVASLQSINLNNNLDNDFGTPLWNSLYLIKNQESSNNIFYDGKYDNLFQNLVPIAKKDKMRRLSKNSEHSKNMNFSSEENKIDNLEESKILSNSDILKMNEIANK